MKSKQTSKLDILKRLTDGEKDQLLNAIPLITVFIAGADDEIDQEEIDWAKKLTNIRSFANNDLLHEYYEAVGEGFDRKLDTVIKTSPKSVSKRNKQISEKLEMLNPILAKLEPKIGYTLYNDFKSFGEHVAKASGGILRFFSVSQAEKKLTPLSMLNPIHFDEEE